MRGWIIIIVFFGGLFALCWYGATGETGPMGWFNSWQVRDGGSYSRALSFGILCACLVAVALPFLAVGAVAAQKSRARTGVAPPTFTAPADAKVAAMVVAMNDRSRWRWRMYLSIWLVGLALVWAAVLGWNGWDFHRRAADAGSYYTPLRLDRTTPVARPDDGSHLALQGRLLWDHGVTQTTKDGSIETETVYVPVAGADWRPGDPVQFVLQIDRTQVWSLQHRADGPDAPLTVRVGGAIPTASRAVFRKAEAPPVDAAVLVEVVASNAGQVSDAHPGFDWETTRLVGLGLSATWTAGIWIGALAVLAKVLQLRRRQARPTA